ncbi:hypothetical protein BDY19DRAFT_997199 [Irpex rosettiformis]|uniref:Uncharacterized protein n=1 Tax=Irpex rosettiformis TaxID=378272 RepID=A0ACB8TSK2_9APHY|nr:hypothetical protein BDY19DRAFT_997199 [Irpex rosettiformis]
MTQSSRNSQEHWQRPVFIAGSGPIGATFARLLTRHGYNVVMAEIGDQYVSNLRVDASQYLTTLITRA